MICADELPRQPSRDDTIWNRILEGTKLIIFFNDGIFFQRGSHPVPVIQCSLSSTNCYSFFWLSEKTHPDSWMQFTPIYVGGDEKLFYQVAAKKNEIPIPGLPVCWNGY
jgi:hypothetical protein